MLAAAAMLSGCGVTQSRNIQSQEFTQIKPYQHSVPLQQRRVYHDFRNTQIQGYPLIPYYGSGAFYQGQPLVIPVYPKLDFNRYYDPNIGHGNWGGYRHGEGHWHGHHNIFH